MVWSRAFTVLAFSLMAGSAFAAPSSSCAGKFVGTWQHGASNVATLTRDGRAICSGNAFCQQGTWSCSGNSLTYINSGGTFVYTLQSSGVMTYGSIVVTRIGGGGPSVRSTPPKASDNSGERAASAVGISNNRDKPVKTKDVVANTKQEAPIKAPSCGSDITGTGDSAPAPNESDCKEAGRSLNAARQLRKQKQFALLVPEEYKKAAAAAQRAGDTELLLKIIEEAKQPDPPEVEKADPYKEGLLRDANRSIGSAQDILSKPATCGDMKDAEMFYLRAAKNFLDSDEFEKTNEMTRKHDALAETVDRLETEGKCKVPQVIANQLPNSTKNNQTDYSAKCQQALESLKKLDEPTKNMASIGEPEEERPPNYNVVVTKMKLAAEGCNIPNTKKYTDRECMAARIYMANDGVPTDDISAIVKNAGC